jgi:hypothetical protein
MDQGKARLPSNLSTSVSDLLTLVYSLPAQLGPTRMGTVRARSAQVLQTLTCSTMAICGRLLGPGPSIRTGWDVRFSSAGSWRDRSAHTMRGHIFDLQVDHIAAT